jgi:hypothetical protein
MGLLTYLGHWGDSGVQDSAQEQLVKETIKKNYCPNQSQWPFKAPVYTMNSGVR